MTDKEDVVGVHSPDFGSEENIGSVNGSVQKSGINNSALADGMVKKSNRNYDQARCDQVPAIIIDGQRLYNLAIHNNYAAHYILIDIKGKGFQFYTFTFG
jgi:hypothetical protein